MDDVVDETRIVTHTFPTVKLVFFKICLFSSIPHFSHSLIILRKVYSDTPDTVGSIEGTVSSLYFTAVLVISILIFRRSLT